MARTSSHWIPSSRWTARAGSPPEGPTTAQRIADAGGSARASNTSVTDREAVESLFGRVGRGVRCTRRGGERGRHLPSHRLRLRNRRRLGRGAWRPPGRISQRPRRGAPADGRGRARPHPRSHLGIGMAPCEHRGLRVRQARGRRAHLADRADDTGRGHRQRPLSDRRHPDGHRGHAPAPAGSAPQKRDARTGGLGLGSMPPPEHLGPVGAYLAGDEFSWCNGQVIFSGGSELALITPPRLLEVCRSRDVASLPHALESIIPKAFVTAEAAQATNGGSNPRFPRAFDEPATDAGAGAPGGGNCVLVTDDPSWGTAVRDALGSQGVKCMGVGALLEDQLLSAEIAQGFAAVADQLARAARDAGPLDAVVVALRDVRSGADSAPSGDQWRGVLDEHASIAEKIRTDAGWARAVSDYSARESRPVRLVTRHRRHLHRGQKQSPGCSPAGPLGSYRDLEAGRRVHDQRGGRRRSRTPAHRRAGHPPRPRFRGDGSVRRRAGRGIGVVRSAQSPEPGDDRLLRRTRNPRMAGPRHAQRRRR